MRVLIAIDSFKGSLSSRESSEAIAEGVKDVFPDAEFRIVPIADGGEGTVEAMVQATDGKLKTKEVTGPLTEKVNAVYGILGDGQTVVIEVANVCGLPLLSDKELNPLYTTTRGVGELIVDAMEKGYRNFVVGLGGSATNDAGVGMLQALGYSFLDDRGREIGLGGEHLKRITNIRATDVHPLLNECHFKVACDVTNPLYGPNGAAYVFAPQKGATSEMVLELDKGLENIAQVMLREFGIDIQNLSGAGAAGGLGAAFAGFLGASLESGVQIVLKAAKVDEKMKWADFVITGEGKLDNQTSMGKAPLGIAKLASRNRVPVIALAGSIQRDAEVLNTYGITSFFSIANSPMTLERAMDPLVAFDNLQLTVSQLFRLIEALQPSYSHSPVD